MKNVWKNLISFSVSIISNVRFAGTLIVRHVRTQQNIQLNWNGRIFCMQQRCVLCLLDACGSLHTIPILLINCGRLTHKTDREQQPSAKRIERGKLSKLDTQIHKTILCYGMHDARYTCGKTLRKPQNKRTNEMQKKRKQWKYVWHFIADHRYIYWSVYWWCLTIARPISVRLLYVSWKNRECFGVNYIDMKTSSK